MSRASYNGDMNEKGLGRADLVWSQSSTSQFEVRSVNLTSSKQSKRCDLQLKWLHGEKNDYLNYH